MTDEDEKPIVPTGSGSGNVGAVIDSRAVAREFADLKMASDTRPPNFTGGAGDEVETWMRKFNWIVKALDWDDKRKLV